MLENRLPEAMREFTSFFHDRDCSRHGLIPLFSIEEIGLHERFLLLTENGFSVILNIASRTLQPGYAHIFYREAYHGALKDGIWSVGHSELEPPHSPLFQLILPSHLQERKLYSIINHKL